MPVSVSLSTTLRSYVPDYQPTLGLTLDIEAGMKASELAKKIGLPLQDIKITMLNGQRVDLEALVTDGDRVAFFPAVGGG